MVEQKVARLVAQHDMQRRPRQRVVERRVEKLLDPGGVEVFGLAVPGIAHRPDAGATMRLRRRVGAHRDLARDGAAIAGEFCLPGAGGGSCDLAEPGIGRAVLPGPRTERDPAVGPGQGQLALHGLFGGKQHPQRRPLPGRNRRRQEGDVGLLAAAGTGFGLRCVGRAQDSENGACRQQRSRCGSSEAACCRQWNPLPWKAATYRESFG